MKDYYKILIVQRAASAKEIKKHFRIRAIETHPDKTGKDTKTEFIEVYEAYAVLSNTKEKERYDKLYDLFFDARNEGGEPEIKMDLKQIVEKASFYAENFNIFNKEVLRQLLFELFLGSDALLFASGASIFFGLWTIGKGLFTLDFGYSIVGLLLTLVGLFFGWLKINSVIKSSQW